MKPGQSFHFNDKNTLKLPLLLQKFSIFPDFPIFPPKMAILSQLLPQSPDRETKLRPLDVLISILLPCIYH